MEAVPLSDSMVRLLLLLLLALGSSPSLANTTSSSTLHCQSARFVDLKTSTQLSASGDAHAVISKLQAATARMDFQTLSRLFHPRMGVSARTLHKKVMRVLHATEPPIAASVQGLWILSKPNGSGCTDRERGLHIYPLYGYDQQIALIISLRGAQDLARVYAHLVFYEGHWVVGSFSAYRITHLGEPSRGWFRKALKSMGQERSIQAYRGAWIAARLEQGGGYFESLLRHSILLWTEEQQLAAIFRRAIDEAIQPSQEIYVSPLFAHDGVGLLVRFRVSSEPSTDSVRSKCRKTLDLLSKQAWYQESFGGLRCSFVLPRESIESEGILGSLWLTK